MTDSANPQRLTNRPSQPLAVATRAFDLMNQSLMFATLVSPAVAELFLVDMAAGLSRGKRSLVRVFASLIISK